jgi:hypothetical protein
VPLAHEELAVLSLGMSPELLMACAGRRGANHECGPLFALG